MYSQDVIDELVKCSNNPVYFMNLQSGMYSEFKII